MSESICARSAVFHLMVLSHMKEDVLEFHTVMFNIPAVFKEKILHCISMTWRKVLITHDVTWSRKDSFCKGQFTDDQPEEKPSVPVKISITQKKEDPPKSAFAKFAFGGDRNE